MMNKMVNGELVALTQEEISQLEIDRAEAEADLLASSYISARQEAYPSIADQLDKIFHHGIEAWKTDIQAIKNDNPKPS